MARIKVAENKHYLIEADTSLNRVYLTIFGFWRNPQFVPDYLKDWKKALSYMKKGFTLLTDAREMKIHPPEVQTLHEQAQELLIKGGVLKVAEILANIFTEVQLNALAKTTNFPKQNFNSIEAAEFWLNASSESSQ